ncbi:A/G-specific adenine glycosylase [Sulfurimonas sp. HSL-3221]|uniref:A/G-specific adenine glycosylase n=1 Tax=Sulfurimonadaceae TaxID=2771471 RepID=UPI001E37A607|nr:A/G-specific adenine glycosylase [Sulfurimonas sp. HSL-3221]UFS63342.1 A/G-specific adenine glycosylase [Sulfurimonas sp. HSL-3221]
MNVDLHTQLLQWYEDHGRHTLPWRNTDDPYRIWVSEIMLQQTQVKTVLERFYFPFLERFPTLPSLACAPLDDVLKQWEGLGYYTRAKNLHKAAQLAAPYLPESVEGLIRLPGVGKSTAHAIAAFAYGAPVPILDANVKRILYRFFGRREADEKTLWQMAEKLFDPEHPFEFNQAMMDIGATLCLPKTTACDACPFESACKGAAGDPLRYPAPKKRKSVPVRERHIVVYRHNGRYGLKQREGRFLHGLWGFHEQTAPPGQGKTLQSIVQVYSHFRLEAQVWLCEAYREELTYFQREEIDTLALSGADHKVLKQLSASRP